MKKIFCSFVLFLAVALGFSFSAAAQQEYGDNEKRISSIKIKGSYAISSATILNRLKVKTGDIFEETALNKEIKRLYAMGYFNDVFVETEDRTEGVVVIFTVVEKPVIDKVEFSGNSKIKDGRLSKDMLVKQGTLLDFNIIAQDMERIRTMYIEKGFSNVEVDYKINTDPETGKAVVVFIVDEGVSQRIKSITFEGNEHISGGELSKFMTTKTAWWFIRKGALDQDKFDADINRIKALYRTKGYLDVKVKGVVNYSEDNSQILIVIDIKEGNEYKVGEIIIEGELAFPESEIRDKVKIKSGDAFDYTVIKDDVESIRGMYYNKGYMDAEIDLQHKYNSKTDRMDIKFIITSHDEIYVGIIDVIGNTKTKDKVIRRELRLYPGEKFDGKKMKVSKERIYNLGFFEDVYFDTVSTSEEDVKDLKVTVKEAKTGELSFGGGYSSIDAFIGFAQIGQRNFDIMNFPTFQGGGQNLTIRAELGSTRNNFLVSWTDPWFLDFPYLFGFDVYRQEHDRSGTSGYDYDEIRTGGSLRLGKDLTDEIATGLIYNLEEVKISDIPSNSSEALRREKGTNWLSRITWNIGYDTRDNKYSPKEGFISTLSLENTGGFIGGDKDFVKGFLMGAYYYSFWEKNLVLELKGRAGLAESYGNSDEVPIYERFFAGGATTIRGYQQRAVGPRDSGSNSAVGGEALLIGNAEFTFPVFKNIIKGAVFYDVGNVWDNSSDVLTSGGYKAGAGIGVRVKTPIGPVKLDYGYPLVKNHDDKREGEFYFSVSNGF